MKAAPSRRRGFALMLVVMEMLLLLALWGVAYRQLASAMRLVNVLAKTQPSGTPQLANKPVARALILLETGDPPGDAYVCGVAIQGTGGPAYFLVSFTPAEGSLSPGAPSGSKQWTVHSIQVQQSDLTGYPTMPYSFGP
jgi:hypothetical protein